MQIEKLCLFCKHFWFDTGGPGWETTPEEYADIGCKMERFPYTYLYRYTDHTFRKQMLAALTCSDFEFDDEIKNIIAGMKEPARPSPISVTSNTPDCVTLTVD